MLNMPRHTKENAGSDMQRSMWISAHRHMHAHTHTDLYFCVSQLSFLKEIYDGEILDVHN